MSETDDDDRALLPFEQEGMWPVRRQWHNGQWYLSIIDVVRVLTDSAAPRQYWTDTKKRMQGEGYREVSEKILQLKMRALDGKMRTTEVANVETMLRIIQSIPSPKAEPFKQWLARVGAERLEEVGNPELAADRMRQLYRARGYSDEWIDRRLQGIVIRDELTQEWRERGAEEGKQFAILTDILSRGTFDVSTAEHKEIKALKSRDNVRDSMTTMELLLTALAEETSKTLHQVHDSQGMKQLEGDVREAGDFAGTTRRDFESRTGQQVVSNENYMTLTARQRQPSLFDNDDQGQ